MEFIEKNDCAKVILDENLLIDDVNNFVSKVEDVFKKGKKIVVVNIKAAPFIDSMTVGIFIKAKNIADKYNGKFIIEEPTEKVMDYLISTRLDKRFNIISDIAFSFKQIDNVEDSIVFKIENDRAVLKINGVIDNYEHVKQIIRIQDDQFSDLGAIIVDFEDAKFIGSSVIGELINLHRWASANNIKLLFCSVNHNIAELLDNLGLNLIIPYCKDKNEARQKIQAEQK